MNRRAFSLPELLIGIVLIAALVLLGSSALQSSREKSQQIHCMGNLRQVGIDVRLYLSENRGVLPWLEQPFIFTRWWYRVYSKENFGTFDKRLLCPADQDPYRLGFQPTPQRTLWCSYRYNKKIGYNDADGTPRFGGSSRNLLTVSNASRLKLIADAPRVPHGGRAHTTTDSMGFNSASELFGDTLKEGMHAQGQRTTMLFLDGHIESITLPEFYAYDSDPLYQ